MDRFKTTTIAASTVYGGLLIAPIIFKDLTYISLIPAFAATSTIYLGLIKYWMDADLVFKELFKDFNERFDKLSKDLNLVAAGSLPNGERAPEQIIQDYLNLCAEEYYWYKKGSIPEKVWTSWSNGINYYLSYPVIRDYFLGEQDYKNSYYGFFSY